MSEYFAEECSAEAVIERMRDCKDPRLAMVMGSFVRHLHAFIKEVEPTEAEWMAGIEFLTETGHMCDEWRQEFILWSDTFGASMLVDAINNRKPTGATESTVLGPFHVANTPKRENGANLCLDGKGEPLVMLGRVTSTTGSPIAGATLDIWQANEEGFYDVQQKGIQPDGNLRGMFTADDDGQYWFRTVKPKHYAVPHDGPVGRLLAAVERHPNRPAHVHVIAAADGYESVTTHVFVPDDPYIDSDAVFGVKETLLGDFVHIDDQAQAQEFGVANPFWRVEANFTLAPSSTHE